MSTQDARNIWQAFEQVAQTRADSLALVCGDETLTFSQLVHQALRCARWLHGLSIRSGDVVALQLPKRPASYALWLACLRQGAVYVFVDPANPVERTQKILSRTRPRLFVSTGDTEDLPSPSVRLDEVEALLSSVPSGSDSRLVPPAQLHGLSPAYIMFTSGSTGEPKGAVIPHQGVLSLMAWVRSWLGNVADHSFSNLNPLHFDNSVFDLYGGLLNGAKLVSVETAQSHNPLAWVKTIRTHAVTVMFAVPTLYLTLSQLRLLTPASLPAVAFFLFGGEGFPIEALKQFHARFLGQARLINVYGPTETSCICSSLELDADALQAAGSGFASLGQMHPGFEYVILDQDGAPCADGESGELCIGGANVGLGYFANPAETARRFIQNPQQSDYRSIWYRSGDLVRRDGSGRLWFRGRVDNQVKVRGHRIELEEIDLALESFSGVTRAVAVVCEGRDGPEIRVAFSANLALVDSVLLAHCKARLPKYMHPANLVRLPDIPRNANGKADRRAIAKLLGAGLDAGDVVPRQG